MSAAASVEKRLKRAGARTPLTDMEMPEFVKVVEERTSGSFEDGMNQLSDETSYHVSARQGSR